MAPGWKRNSALFVAGVGTASTAAYFGRHYLLRKLLSIGGAGTDASQMDAAKQQQHFEDNQSTCASTLHSTLPSVVEMVTRRFDTRSLTAQLKANPSNKLQLWRQLKVNSYAQYLSLVYGSCLLGVLLKVEINILGGNMFRQLSRPGSEGAKSGHAPIEKQYLSSVQFFIESGILKVCELVEQSVEAVLEGTALKDQLTLHRVTEQLLEIHSALMQRVRAGSSLKEEKEEDEGEEEGTFASFMFSPSIFSSVEGNPLLVSLTNATQDVLECPDLAYVLENVVQRGILTLTDLFQEAYHSSVQGARLASLPLARVIPLLTDTASSLARPQQQSRLVQGMLSCRELEVFSQNIYEAFSADLEY